MREEEKILISAFFDDELINEEKARAENLIANDPEAYEYFQTLNVLDNELSTFASKSLSSKQAQDAFQFIDNLKPDSDQASSGFFSKLFGLQNGSVSALTNNRLGLAFSFAFLFSAGFLSNQFFLGSSSGETNYTLDQFSYSDIVTKEIIKTRSGMSEDTFDDNLQALLTEMVELKAKTGRLNYGSESYIIFLESKFNDAADEKYFCYKGIVELDDEREFVFCKGLQESSLLYIN